MSNEIIPTPPAVDVLRQITSWIVAGFSEGDILDAVREKYPDSKPKPLIIQALKNLAKAGAEPDGDLVRGFALEGTRAIYQKSLEVGDHKTALRALAQLVKLAGATK